LLFSLRAGLLPPFQSLTHILLFFMMV
jgi:hypothetical protein